MKKIASIAFSIMLIFTLTSCGYDGGYRYPCQDPANWDKEICKMPVCDVNRTCPEHIFKGQRDPRLGPPAPAEQTQSKPINQCTGGCK